MEKAKLTQIQIDNMPDLNNLIPMAVYYVRNEEIIIETDKNAFPKFFGLKSQYPDANLPLSNTDKFLVRQGNDWKEINKSDVGGGKQLLKFEWSGSIYSQKDKKQFAVFNYGYPRNYIRIGRYLQTNDIMSDNYRVPFIPVQPFQLKLKYIVFDVGMRQYPRPYDISLSLMKAEYTNVDATKQHVLLQDVTTKGGSGNWDANKDVFIFDESKFLVSELNINEFLVAGFAIDNTNDSANRSLYFANFVIYAEII